MALQMSAIENETAEQYDVNRLALQNTAERLLIGGDSTTDTHEPDDKRRFQTACSSK